MKTEKTKSAPDFLTYPLSFDTWRWYKPVLTGLMTLALNVVLILAASVLLVWLGVKVPEKGTEAFTVFGVVTAECISAAGLPLFFLSSKAVRERPFSSYASSRGGFSRKLYGRFLGVSLALCLIVFGAAMLLSGLPFAPVGTGAPAGLAFIVLMMPLLGIGYAFLTGFVGQTFASWFKNPAAGAAAVGLIWLLANWGNGTAGRVSSLIVALGTAFVTWRTKGVEAAAAFWTGLSLCLFLMSGQGTGMADLSSLPAAAGGIAASVLYSAFIGLIAEKGLHWLSAAEQAAAAPAARPSPAGRKKKR